MRKKRRLIWQLYPSYLVVILLALLAISWYTSQTLKQSYLDRTKSDLQAQGQLLMQQVTGLLAPFEPTKIDRLCKKVGENTTTRFTVVAPDGTVIGDSNEIPRHMDNHGNRPEIAAANGGNVGASTRYSKTLEQSMMYVALPLTIENRIVAVVRTSIPLTAVEAAIWSWQLKIILAGLLIALLASGVCLFISRSISRPIETMTQGAERFARGDLKHRLKPSETLELARLAKAMNQMAGELKNRIESLVNQRNEYEAVLTSMIEGVIAVDMDERILSINQAAVTMLKITALDLKGRNILEAIRNQNIHEFIVDALNSGTATQGDVVVHQRGEMILNTQCTPLRNAGDERIGTLVVLNDVTKMRHLENVRRDFVANVSHEIKTPLTAIKGFVETILNSSGEDPETLLKFLKIINKHADRLGTIIEDLLSLARLEQQDGSSKNNLVNRNVRDIIDTAVQIVKSKADEKKIDLKITCSSDIAVSVDPTLIEQAIVNLLDNAIKYSPENDRIEIKTKWIDQKIAILIKDNGPGIAVKHQPRLFERFYRVDKARSRKLGGTGLGLAIVKHIAQTHGGSVTVDSSPGHGSTFTLVLPIAPL